MVGSIDHFVDQQIYNADIADPGHDELVANAGTPGAEGAAAPVIGAFQFHFGGAAA